MALASKPVRTRFAPSPTGYLHIGGLRTALYAWLFARHHGGAFLLRVEDTDRARYVEGAIEKLYDVLMRMDLVPDEGLIVEHGQIGDRGAYGPYLQSKRRERHLAYAYDLIARGHAYYCFCSPERLQALAEEQKAQKQPTMYDRCCRDLSKQEAENRAAVGESHVIRLAVPLEGTFVFEDLIRGTIEIPWSQVDDAVLIKSDGYPTYHLASMCDDHDMEITHIIRGEEWLSSVPKHAFLFQAMGWETPAFVHLPLLLNPDKTKLSKRQGDVAVEDYLAKGYLPEALLNFVGLLGFNPTGDRELFTKEELAELFDVRKVNKSGAVFNAEKLDWLNGQYVHELSDERYAETCRVFAGAYADDPRLMRACRVLRERLQVFSQLQDLLGGLLAPKPEHAPELIVWKKATREASGLRLRELRQWLADQPDHWFEDLALIESNMRTLLAERGWENGDTLWPLRTALSGMEKSPSPFELLFIYQKTESLARIDEALSRLA